MDLLRKKARYDKLPPHKRPRRPTATAAENPDPGRSYLCTDCDELMKVLQNHPWADLEKASRPFGLTHLTTEQAQRLRNWYIIKIPESPLTAYPCTFCQLIRNLILSHIYTASEPSSNGSCWRYSLKPTKYGQAWDLDQRRSIGQPINTTKKRHDRWCISIEFKSLSNGNSSFELRNAIRCAFRPLPTSTSEHIDDTNSGFVHRTFMLGRQRGLTCDLELLRKWPLLCSKYHGVECGRAKVVNDGVMRLIDTRDQCIVTTHLFNLGPRAYASKVFGSGMQDYVALSYVWGEKEQSYAETADEYSALYKKGSLLSLKLPKTISDAMLLVQQLGLRYLWVDALCIQQSDASDKHDQIAGMGFVYQNALFTIIAASGVDCDAGLPGFRPGTRFKEQTIIERGYVTVLDSVVSCCDGIINAESSKWASRGWTFQEEHLSARQMIFTDEQVWWRCPCSTWNEETQLESFDAVSFLPDGESVMLPLEKRYSKLEPDVYFKLVTAYAQRDLSYASDGLNAFAGILSMLTEYSGATFFWGLMTRDLQRQLMWFGGATRRTSTHTNELPTWSWVSWKGELIFGHYLAYDPSIVCYTIKEGSSGLKTLQTCQSVDFKKGIANTNLREKYAVNMNEVNAAYPVQYLKPDFHLIFYTYTATFFQTPQGRLVLPSLPIRYQYNDRGKLLGPYPDYGYLVPSPPGSELCEMGNRECILMGRKELESGYDESHVVVMLIERHPRSGIAYRLGLADMPEEFWELAPKTWELIALG